MSKVLIGLPNTGGYPPKTVASLIQLNTPKETGWAFVGNSLVYDARNDCCDMVLKEDYDYLLFIDADMIFPEDSIKRLINLDADVATAVYYARSGKHQPQVYSKIYPRTNEALQICERFTEVPDGVFEVEGCGMGLCLIKREVIEAVTKEWYAPFEPLPGLGEDFSFCYKARERGFKILADSTIEVGHIGERVYTKEDYKA